MKGLGLKRFSEAVLALQDCATPGEFGQALLRSMQSLLSADVHTVNWFGSVKIDDISNRAGDVPMEDALEILNAHLHEHPLLPMVEAVRMDGTPRARRWSDVVTLRRFRQTGLYHDFFRPIGSDRQIALALRITPDAFAALTFNRDGRDFCPEDGETLMALAPHVIAAARAKLAQVEVEDTLALREMAVGTDAVMIVDGFGDIHFSTERASGLVQDYFGEVEDEKLPLELADWLRRIPPPAATFVRHRAADRLICTCGPAMPWRPNEAKQILNGNPPRLTVRCLRLTEESERNSILDLQRLGFTPREAAVALWLIKGKRDGEIAQILTISRKTVEKHVGAIFAKLGVETRTAAAAEVLCRRRECT